MVNRQSRVAIGLVVGIVITAIFAGVLLPAFMGQFATNEATQTLDVDDEYTLSADLTVTLDSVTDGTDATYTVATDDDSDTVTVNEGESETATVGDTDVTISVSDVDVDSATGSFEYPTSYGWGSGTASFWAVVPVMIILGIVLLFVQLGLRQA